MLIQIFALESLLGASASQRSASKSTFGQWYRSLSTKTAWFVIHFSRITEIPKETTQKKKKKKGREAICPFLLWYDPTPPHPLSSHLALFPRCCCASSSFAASIRIGTRPGKPAHGKMRHTFFWLKLHVRETGDGALQ